MDFDGEEEPQKGKEEIMLVLLTRDETYLYARGWNVHRGVFSLDKIPNRRMGHDVILHAHAIGDLPVPDGQALWYRQGDGHTPDIVTTLLKITD